MAVDPKLLTPSMVYALTHQYAPEIVGYSYDNRYQVTEPAQKLIKIVFPDSLSPWLIQPGCYYGAEALLDAMHVCYQKSGAFKEILERMLRKDPSTFDRTEIPELYKLAYEAGPDPYRKLFDQCVAELSQGKDIELETEWFGWLSQMHKKVIKIKFSAADVKGVDSQDIRCAIAQQVTEAMLHQIGQSGQKTSHDYRDNLHANVLVWTRAQPTDQGYVAPNGYNSTPYLQQMLRAVYGYMDLAHAQCPHAHAHMRSDSAAA